MLKLFVKKFVNLFLSKNCDVSKVISKVYDVQKEAQVFPFFINSIFLFLFPFIFYFSIFLVIFLPCLPCSSDLYMYVPWSSFLLNYHKYILVVSKGTRMVMRSNTSIWLGWRGCGPKFETALRHNLFLSFSFTTQLWYNICSDNES